MLISQKRLYTHVCCGVRCQLGPMVWYKRKPVTDKFPLAVPLLLSVQTRSCFLNPVTAVLWGAMKTWFKCIVLFVLRAEYIIDTYCLWYQSLLITSMSISWRTARKMTKWVLLGRRLNKFVPFAMPGLSHLYTLRVTSVACLYFKLHQSASGAKFDWHQCHMCCRFGCVCVQ